jgi:hypothetical protein
LPFRIMLVGGKFGPGVFAIAELLGNDETVLRIRQCLKILDTLERQGMPCLGIVAVRSL